MGTICFLDGFKDDRMAIAAFPGSSFRVFSILPYLYPLAKVLTFYASINMKNMVLLHRYVDAT